MSEIVLQTRMLSKKYRSQWAVNKVDLQVMKGDIYGFIGKNGAGKTTLMRMAAGLAEPTSGEISLFGAYGARANSSQRKRMGVLIESPAMVSDLTAEANLELARIERGIPGKKVVENNLLLVGLHNTGRKKVRDFSLGMKQKLGIAMALLGEPDFLMLDEPINGLDPAGIIEIRELVKRLNTEKGITIMISSHLLSELHQVATKYGIIHNGIMLEQLTQRELDNQCRKYLLIKVDDIAKATVILEKELFTSNYQIMSDGTLRLFDFIDNPRLVSGKLTENGLFIEQITQSGASLEEYFIKRIKEAEAL